MNGAILNQSVGGIEKAMGTYTGDGTELRRIELPFEADVVFISGYNNSSNFPISLFVRAPKGCDEASTSLGEVNVIAGARTFDGIYNTSGSLYAFEKDTDNIFVGPGSTNLTNVIYNYYALKF